MGEERAGELLVFPNPANERISVTSIEGRMNALIITSADGRMVLAQASNGSSADLDVHALRAGAYFLEARLTSGRVLRSRFIKN
ncbi:MAG: T9SS type A sorting domain-containing protein [Flavobacteriales bacterium]|nr:T9SS type A sorting domain-containing protein [Flavobacteriales bacterium]